MSNITREGKDKSKGTVKQNKLLENLYIYKSPQTAALKAGYTESIARNITSYIKESPYLTKQIQDLYKANSVMRLPGIARIERNVVKHCGDLNNVDNVAKHNQMLKHIKQSAGVMADDNVLKSPTINIQSIEKVQVVVSDMINKRLEHTKNENG